MNSTLDERAINTLRFLAVDAVEKAKSGHPGAPMGAATIVYTLFDRFLRFDPRDPKWPDRDRFVLSAGHASAMLYAMLHLTGYDVALEDLKRFRQFGSITPGHTECTTPGVEATTGPLGQGFGNAVGMAVAESALAATFNREGHEIVDHFVYCLASDGDLMEGVSNEAASLAGHWELGKLVVLYDDNRISIEGSTEIAFTEDRSARFAALGWHVQDVADGNDIEAISAAISAAREETRRPSFVNIRTHIGYGSPHKQDTAAAHGEPLGEEEVRLAKERLGWPIEPDFLIPDDALAHCRVAVEKGERLSSEWAARLSAYAAAHPQDAAEFRRRMAGELPAGWDAALPVFDSAGGDVATREASGKVMNALAPRLPELMGGSADLSPSTKTYLDDFGDYQAAQRAGRNMHFGVREHAMGAIVNGMAYHGGLMPFGSTFLIFSDYMRPPIRLAAICGIHVIHVFTHDSIGLGEDGPTHQPIEHLVGLRAIPGLLVIRPADANETAAGWRVAIDDGRPALLALTRQKLPVLEPLPALAEGVARGGYVLADVDGPPDIVLVATGSEVHLALEAVGPLAERGVRARVVSMPCIELFAEQTPEYRASVIPPDVAVMSVEAGATLGWRGYLGPKLAALGVDRFGASAPGATVMREYGFTVESVVEHAVALLGEGAEARVRTFEPS